MSKPKKSQPQTATDRKAMLLWPFVDFAEEGPDELAAYLVHVDITNTMIKYAGNVERAILAHYRIGNSVHFDIEKASRDLETWPPIARRIEELRAEQKQ